ncbi:hypothetical protein T484DRAFT_1795888 [Baffinella frigidus]|nr:hypothetical protein T484DRAFT_1795888 [Cryptophyta sp. CCMP2293]
MEWIKESPKVELHVHLDGAFCTDILWRLAKEEGVTAGLPEEVQTPWSGASIRNDLFQ